MSSYSHAHLSHAAAHVILSSNRNSPPDELKAGIQFFRRPHQRIAAASSFSTWYSDSCSA